MSRVLDLARPELRALRPYTPGAYEADFVRLNANESPWRAPGDSTARGLNRYPPPRPLELRALLASHYGVADEEMLVTRGSSEAIDVLVRGFCRAGASEIVICPPTFDMYRLYAGIQDVAVRSVPLLPAEEFAVDLAGVLDALNERSRIVFLCSPNNPTGSSVPRGTIEAICEAAAGRALVVIDEAYREFSGSPGSDELRQRYDHVVQLRTLSKSVSLAGVRCGVLLGALPLVEFLEKVLPPYTFSTPCIEWVVKALSTDSLAVSEERLTLLRRERARLSAALSDLPQVVRVWPSDANFVLVETLDASDFVELARRGGILVRVFAGEPALANCVRITVGRPQDNDRLLRAVSGARPSDEG